MSLLKINNLMLGYGSKVIFSDINTEEESGQIIALLGSNGRGKSTLLRTVAGLEPIYEGEILLGGTQSQTLSREDKSKLIAFVSPTVERAEYLSVEGMLSINTYHRTNWLGSLNSSEKDKITSALEEVGLKGFEKRTCNSLSDGEYQRVTIAGALVQDSRIILLDEPTAFLDIANKFLISRLLSKIAHKENKLVIFSTHDLRLAMEVCDKLWVMTGDGFYTGTPSELTMKNNGKGVIERMFDVEGVKFDSSLKSFVMEPDTEK